MRLLLACSIVLSICAAGALAQTAAPTTTRQVGTATLQNVPEVTADVVAAVQRYQNYRAASFQDWLSDGSILIATRFGSTQQIHRVTSPGGDRTQITFQSEPVAGAIAIPGTQRFVFVRDTGGDEWFQIFSAGLSGDPAQLTETGTRNQSAAFSPDGQMIAWSRATKGSGEYAIYVADPANARSAKSVYREAGSIGPDDISADRTQLLFTRSISNRESKLFMLDLASGKAKEIAPKAGKVRYDNARLARDGRSVYAISTKDSDFGRLVQIDVASGKDTVLTPDLKWDVETFTLSDDDRLLAYSVNEDGFSNVVVRDLVTRRALPQPQLPRGVLQTMAFSPDKSKLAFDLSTATSAGDVWTWDVTGANLTRWTTSELGGLDPAKLAEPQLVRFKSFDGQSIPALVYRPAGIAADVRTPVIMDIHGGPEGQSRPSWNVGAQYFAGVLGATVILPNVRGSTGYGRRYADLDNAEKREDSVKDIGALLDWIATQPNLDKNRVAVYGQSYGGYMSLAVSTHYADRLVGSVERYGISDFASFLKNTEAYRRDNRRAEYGDERDPKMQAVFKRIAPLANVAKITKPMLVMQGANDPRVPKSESDQVVAGIRANGVETWYVVFADEGHGFLKKPNNDLRREVETVFLRKLFRQPRPVGESGGSG
ncbi:MAG TPA: prolyl oligopeptidase family serine peptidase [Steroidobacteraceae bacterium]|nr:prolyl oligopeptidase family serine peptidase [Steroidobacteraceae bacterium]